MVSTEPHNGLTLTGAGRDAMKYIARSTVAQRSASGAALSWAAGLSSHSNLKNLSNACLRLETSLAASALEGFEVRMEAYELVPPQANDGKIRLRDHRRYRQPVEVRVSTLTIGPVLPHKVDAWREYRHYVVDDEIEPPMSASYHEKGPAAVATV